MIISCYSHILLKLKSNIFSFCCLFVIVAKYFFIISSHRDYLPTVRVEFCFLGFTEFYALVCITQVLINTFWSFLLMIVTIPLVNYELM